MLKLGFIGTGNMARALIKSMVSEDAQIISSDKSEEKLQKAKQEFHLKTTKNNKEVVKSSEIIFLCAKPKDFTEILEEIKDEASSKIIVSIAAGIKIDFIETILGENKKIVRVIPNLNCVVGEMAAAYSCNKNISSREKGIIKNLLDKAGLALETEEKNMDAVTALSGSGPAFVSFILKAFASAGEQQGLSKETSYKLALRTFFGTSKLLKDTNERPEDLIARVSSPGGTTIAGLTILENSKIKNIISKTIESAARRSKELGK